MRKWEAEHDADFGYATIQNYVDGPVAILAWRHQAEHLHSLTGTKERAWRLGAVIVDALNAAETWREIADNAGKPGVPLTRQMLVDTYGEGGARLVESLLDRSWADWLEPPALLPAMFVPPSDDELVDEWCHHDPQHKPRDIVAHLIQLDKEAPAAI